MSDKWFDAYGGQTTEQLLALEGEYRTDSLVLAFEQAIQSLNIRDGVTGAKAEAVILAEDAAVHEAHDSCDTGYYDNDEPIADRLFAWIRKNEALVRVGGA